MQYDWVTSSGNRSDAGRVISMMRLITWRSAALGLATSLLLSLTVGCWGGDVDYYVAGSDLKEITKAEVAVGEAFKIHARQHETGSGCENPGDMYVSEGVTWKVEPADGARVEGERFIATKPGVYTVTPVFEKALPNVGISSVVFTVADDGSTSIAPPGDGIDYAPILGTWTYPIRRITWDDVETWKSVEVSEMETIVLSLGPGGVLAATRNGAVVNGPVGVNYDGTTLTVGNPATKDGGEPLFTGTVSGDTITGQITYPGGGKGTIYPRRDVDLAMPWTATRTR